MINAEFTNLFDLLKAFPDEQTCIDHLTELRWNGNIISPFDETSKVYKCAGNKFKCKNSGKYFNVKTITLFDNTKVKLQKWFMAIMLITNHKKGISSLQLASDIGVTQKTAWFMLHRIRNCYGMNDDNEQLQGIVEADETFIGGKNKNRHADKKTHHAQGRSYQDKTAVVGVIERGTKRAITRKVENTSASQLEPVILKYVSKGSDLMTDEWLGYRNLKRFYDHKFIRHNIKEYVSGDVHTNTIEGFWSLLKRGIFGIYHFTSKKHLQMYLDEFTFRYNARNAEAPYRFNMMLSNTEHRLKYKDLIK